MALLDDTPGRTPAEAEEKRRLGATFRSLPLRKRGPGSGPEARGGRRRSGRFYSVPPGEKHRQAKAAQRRLSRAHRTEHLRRQLREGEKSIPRPFRRCVFPPPDYELRIHIAVEVALGFDDREPAPAADRAKLGACASYVSSWGRLTQFPEGTRRHMNLVKMADSAPCPCLSSFFASRAGVPGGTHQVAGHALATCYACVPSAICSPGVAKTRLSSARPAERHSGNSTTSGQPAMGRA